MEKSRRLVEELRDQLNNIVKYVDNHEDEKILEISKKLDKAINELLKN